MTLKTQVLDELFSAFKNMRESGVEFITLKNVEIESILPLSVNSSASKLSAKLDIVVADLDHSPVVVFDIVPEGVKATDRQSEIGRELSLLTHAQIPVNFISVDNMPSMGELRYIIESALEAKKARSAIESESDASSLNKPAVESIAEANSNRRFSYIVIFLAIVAAYLVFLQFKPKSEAEIALKHLEMVPDVPMEQKSNLSQIPSKVIESKPAASSIPVCDKELPVNGSAKVFSTDIAGHGKAYWKFDNKSEQHVVVTVLHNDKKISEIYIAPLESSSFTVVPAVYKYIANSADKWCNTATVNNSGGLNSYTSSSGDTGNKLKDNVLITTSFNYKNGFFGSSIRVEDVE